MLPSSLPLPRHWNVLLPLPAPDIINRFQVHFRFQSLSSKCFRFHKNLTAFSFRFHIPVCNSCDWGSTRFHKLQVTLLGLLGSAICQHVQQPQQTKKKPTIKTSRPPLTSKTLNSDAMAVLVVYLVYHTHDFSQRRCAHGLLLITII